MPALRMRCFRIWISCALSVVVTHSCSRAITFTKWITGGCCEQHVETGAGVTIACVPVPIETASSFGVLGVDENHRVQSFIEKPPPATLASTASTVLASMGIYVFTTDYLVELLNRDAAQADSAHDFGRDILPFAVRESQASAHPFLDDAGQPGYWRDVGTIDSYWQTHMELLAAAPSDGFV